MAGEPQAPPALVRTLAQGSHYALGSLVTVSRAGAGFERSKRVAIDPDSPDHIALTRAEFTPDAETSYVEVPFTSVPAAILRNEVDVGIWHRQEPNIPLELAGLTTSPLTRRPHGVELKAGTGSPACSAQPGRRRVRQPLHIGRTNMSGTTADASSLEGVRGREKSDRQSRP